MEVFIDHLGMNVSEEDEEVHGYSPPVRSVVDVSLTKVSGEQCLLVCLVQAGTPAPCNTRLRLESLFRIIPHHSRCPPYLGLLLDKVLGEHQSLKLRLLAVSGA